MSDDGSSGLDGGSSPDGGSTLPDGGVPPPPPPSAAEIANDANAVKEAAAGLAAAEAGMIGIVNPVAGVIAAGVLGTVNQQYDDLIDQKVAQAKAEEDANAAIPEAYKQLSDQMFNEIQDEIKNGPTLPVAQNPDDDEVFIPGLPDDPPAPGPTDGGVPPAAPSVPSSDGGDGGGGGD